MFEPSMNVASSVPSRAMIRPREVSIRVIRTSRPAESAGRIASGDHAMRQTALSFSPTITSDSVVLRLKSPTRAVWNVTSSGTVALRGSGEPFGSFSRVEGPVVASSERSVISSAMRGSRSRNPSVPTR